MLEQVESKCAITLSSSCTADINLEIKTLLRQS